MSLSSPSAIVSCSCLCIAMVRSQPPLISAEDTLLQCPQHILTTRRLYNNFHHLRRAGRLRNFHPRYIVFTEQLVSITHTRLTLNLLANSSSASWMTEQSHAANRSGKRISPRRDVVLAHQDCSRRHFDHSN